MAEKQRVTVSIIIPVFNVEQYIGDCLTSVINQKYSWEIECILVDDCGCDKSIPIAEKIITEYTGPIKFKIIHQERNTGPGARNEGIRNASGDYIFFLDSDDEISDDCIESLVKPLDNKRYDMVMGDYVVTGGVDRFIHLGLKGGEYLGRDTISYAKRKHMWSPMVWGKLYRRSFLVENGILFCEGIIHEDELFFAEIACLADSIYCLPELKCYYYKVRENSIMTASPYGFKMESCKKILSHMYDFLERNNMQKDQIGNDMLYILYSFSNEVSWRETRKEYHLRYPEYRQIVNRKYGERLMADRRVKAIIRDLHFLLPTLIGKYVYEMMTFPRF